MHTPWSDVELVDLEIGRHDWATLYCGCLGFAGHLASRLSRLARATTEEEASVDGIHALTESQSIVTATLPVVSVALAALADDVQEPARRRFAELILGVLCSDGQELTPEFDGRDVLVECEDMVRGALWLLYREVLSATSVGTGSYAFEILSIVENDKQRLELVGTLAGQRIAADLRHPPR